MTSIFGSGGLAEDHLHGSSMGETFSTIIADQFERLRDGDRFWYQNVFHGEQLAELENTTLADVIERNTGIQNLQPDVFFAPSVLYVDLRESQATDVTVQTSSDTVEVVNNANGELIASRPLQDVRKLVLVGTDGRPDRITIGPIAEGALAEGIELHPGDKGGDLLRILGTSESDIITVNPNQATVNGVMIQTDGIDRIEIPTLDGDDEVQVADDVEIPVIVDGPSAFFYHRHADSIEQLFGSEQFLDSLYHPRHRR